MCLRKMTAIQYSRSTSSEYLLKYTLKLRYFAKPSDWLTFNDIIIFGSCDGMYVQHSATVDFAGCIQFLRTWPDQIWFYVRDTTSKEVEEALPVASYSTHCSGGRSAVNNHATLGPVWWKGPSERNYSAPFTADPAIRPSSSSRTAQVFLPQQSIQSIPSSSGSWKLDLGGGGQHNDLGHAWDAVGEPAERPGCLTPAHHPVKPTFLSDILTTPLPRPED